MDLIDQARAAFFNEHPGKEITFCSPVYPGQVLIQYFEASERKHLDSYRGLKNWFYPKQN